MKDLRILATIVLAVLALASCSSERASTNLRLPSGDAAERGRMLATTVAACGFCHGATAKPGAPLSGGRTLSDRHGKVTAANITPDQTTGIGGWSVTQFVRALRSHLGPKDQELSTQMHSGYPWMSDPDLLAIASYLRTLPPARREVDRRGLGMVSRNTTGILEARNEIEGYVPAIETRFTNEYGKYLVDHVAQCSQCHNGAPGMFGGGSYLGGGMTIRIEGDDKVAPSLVPSKGARPGKWDQAGLVTFLETGTVPGSRRVDPKFCPVSFYASAPELEKKAIAAYLSSLRAIE